MEKCDTLVKGGTVITSEDTLEANIAIKSGKIVGLISPEQKVKADSVIDAESKYIIPGGVDPHVHFMDPGSIEKEDFPTGTAAATVGGITTVAEHHHSAPIMDKETFLQRRKYLKDRSRIDFGLIPHGQGSNIDKVEELGKSGALAFKSFTCGVHGVQPLLSDDMHDLFTEIERIGGIGMIHAEDELMLNKNEEKLKKAGKIEGKFLPEWHSKESEQVAVSTTLQIAKQTNVKLWITHLTHPEVLDQVNDAKKEGANVFSETCPRYFYLTKEDMIEDYPYTTFTPPARKENDRKEMWKKLDNGEIDMVNADHAPNTLKQKEEGKENIFKIHFGTPGVETVLPLLLNGVNEGKISLNRLVEVFSENPAKIIDLYPKKGTIRIGSDADFVLVDLDKKYILKNENIVAKSGWTPYDGREIQGMPLSTYLRGEPIMENREIVEKPGFGEFIEK